MAFPEIIDPTEPLITTVASVTAAELRAIKQALCDIFGIAPAPATIGQQAMFINAQGIVTLGIGASCQQDPTLPGEVATKNYVDSLTSTKPTTFTSGSGAFTTLTGVPYYTVYIIGSGGGGTSGGGGSPGGGGGSGAVTIAKIIGGGAVYNWTAANGGPANGGNGGASFAGGLAAQGGFAAVGTTGGAGGPAATTGIYNFTVMVTAAFPGLPGANLSGPIGGGPGWSAGAGGNGGAGNNVPPATNGQNGAVIFVPSI